MGYQTLKELTNTKQRRVSVIQDKAGKCLTEEHEVLTRFTEYCSDLYNHESNGDTTILNGPYDTNDDTFPILREEVEAAVRYLKGGQSPGVDNIHAELINNGGEAITAALTIICNTIWETGEWSTPWTKSMSITLPKEIFRYVKKRSCNQPNQPPEKGDAKSNTQQAETASERDHRRRTNGFYNRQEHD